VIDSIKVFGERHSGTNAIGYFSGKNFNLQFKHYNFLGWKHRLAPEQAEWSKFDVESCLFIFCLRNPRNLILLFLDNDRSKALYALPAAKNKDFLNKR